MKEIKRSHKKLDPDFKAILMMYRALKSCSSSEMLDENLKYIAGYFGYEAIKKNSEEPCGCKTVPSRMKYVCKEHTPGPQPIG